ncbi:MAG: helix-turn-helix domain-containing protein [Pseudonocardiaceae bacterium]
MTPSTVITEPAAVISGSGAYLLARLLKAPPVTAYVRSANWLHGDDFAAAIRAINAASDAWQATVNLPERHNDRRGERSEQHCGTLTVMQASEHLDLGPRQVQRLAQAGRIDGRRIGGQWALDQKSVNIYQRRHQQERAAAA